MPSRVALYARYSSDLQRDASIEDQLRLCREYATRQGWQVIDSYSDRAMSGASMLRPGLQELLNDAARGRFDMILAEGLDRLSRDQEDTARIFKQLNFANIKLFTVAEGEIGELHIGFKSTLNALYLKDLAAKTHRGLRGRIEAGKSAGGLCYGYDIPRGINADGSPTTGDRAINETEALICAGFLQPSQRANRRDRSRSNSTPKATPPRAARAGASPPSTAMPNAARAS